MATNQFVKIGVPNANDDRLKVVADGLPLFGGVQLAVDTTISQFGEMNQCPVQQTGMAWRKEAPHTLRSLAQGRELAWRSWELGMEEGGRWFKEAQTFVQMLAKARVRSDHPCYSAKWSKREVASCSRYLTKGTRLISKKCHPSN